MVNETQPSLSPRERIIAAFMALLAEQPIERIDLAEIAKRAEVSLADLRGEFSTTLAILAAHMKEIDRAVLRGGDGDMAEEPARERLFDVLMRRLEAHAPHREAVRSLLRSAARNPPLAVALNGLAVQSQQWMLAAAAISLVRPEGHGARTGACTPLCLGAAHLARRHRPRARPHHGGARQRARARPALVEPV